MELGLDAAPVPADPDVRAEAEPSTSSASAIAARSSARSARRPAPASASAPSAVRRSVSRTDQPSAAACLASRARRSWSASWRIARPWPSLSSPRSSRASAGSGRSSRRIRLEIAARLRPTRRASSSLEIPRSSTSGGAGPRLLHRVEVLADHVLDQRRLEALVLRRGPDHRGDAVEAGLLRGAPAALAGDQLVAAVVERAERSAAGAARPSRSIRRARRGRPASNFTRGWSGFGSIWATGELAQLGAAGGALGQDRREAPAHPPLALSHPDPEGEHLVGEGAVGPRAGGPGVVLGDRDPVARRLGDADAARDHRLEDAAGQCSRSSRSTSWESRVRSSCMVITTPAISSDGLSSRWTSFSGVEELDQALERQVLGLDRDDHLVGGDQGVDGDRPERGRAVEQRVGEALANRAEALAKPGLVAARRGAARPRRRRGPRARELSRGCPARPGRAASATETSPVRQS